MGIFTIKRKTQQPKEETFEVEKKKEPYEQDDYYEGEDKSNYTL